VSDDLRNLEERHPSPATPRDLLRSVTFGFVGGLRSLMPLALLSVHLEREGPDIADGGWVLDLLASRWAATVLGVAALGELVADKLPFVPARIEPLPLAGRVVLAGTASSLASLAEGRSSDTGAWVGALGAVLGSVTGYWLRMRLPLPSLLLALLEDGLAFVLGRWALQR
jgi:uncharacterized membrane protein